MSNVTRVGRFDTGERNDSVVVKRCSECGSGIWSIISYNDGAFITECANCREIFDAKVDYGP